MVIVDLDRLKETNDRDGHAAGDDLLRAAAQPLLRSCRGTDIVARLGGDEFAVLAVEANAEAVEHVAGRLSAELAASGVRASIGWACRPSGAKGGIAGAVEEADRRMYQVKRTRG